MNNDKLEKNKNVRMTKLQYDLLYAEAGGDERIISNVIRKAIDLYFEQKNLIDEMRDSEQRILDSTFKIIAAFNDLDEFDLIETKKRYIQSLR